MATTETHQNSATIGTTVRYLASNSTTKTDQTTPGVYQLWLDLNALGNGDEFEVAVWERISSAGTTRIAMRWVIAGAQSEPMWVTPPLMFIHGWEFSLQKLAGTDRAIPWSIRQVG
jgi:hypothetical protein